MSSTNETQDKDYNFRFPHFNKNEKKEQKGKKYRNGRFTIKKLPINKNNERLSHPEQLKNNHFENKDSSFEKPKKVEEDKEERKAELSKILSLNL